MKITDETKRIRRIGDSAVLNQLELGDVPLNTTPQLGTILLDPTVTNHVRFDVNALNGFTWEIISFNRVSNGWSTYIAYRYAKVNGKVTIEPEAMRDKLLVY